ncbi:late competence protein [Bacillus sp. NRRL B-14911]|uniref:Phosphoribosyltransferase n=1 Tax=Bacillus infantis NRRL B-14911 TaxID=1367477 RepID=U5LEJ1_9BACI|nr:MULTISPECIES: ComF family protein [Bacillus]AGX06254.1 phosphoribosyltransferase [Bacillus infantis NRRL B-14911]EAR63781.1 late competence protein [Bacillus sp. NRRL B-14911]
MNLFQANHCLICQKEIDAEIGWQELFTRTEEKVICRECEESFEEIKGALCHICGRQLQGLNPQFIENDNCYDCIRWEKDPKWEGILNRNISLYTYNDFLQELIARFKYRGDYILAKVFKQEIRRNIETLKPDFIIPIPLSTERLYERGFNQAEALIITAGLAPSHLLNRIHTEKQSKKSREERIHLSEIFQISTSAAIEAKNLLLIDDIYTTGSTLRHAALPLKQAGAANIMSLTLARG